MRHGAENRPYLFAIGLFIIDMVLAVPFVVAFKVLGLELEPLRLIIPIVQSIFVLWVIWYLGWLRTSGFSSKVQNIGVYWYPLLLAFVPLLVYGSIAVPAGPLLFYVAALFFTGLSEEGMARGLVLRAVLPRGKWVALVFAGALFSVGHFTNLVFEEFTPIEMIEKLLVTFSFAILYGAVFLRTFNIWPLIILHMIHDYAFLTSGTAGPFVVEAISLELSFGLAVVSLAYGIYVATKVKPEEFFAATK